MDVSLQRCVVSEVWDLWHDEGICRLLEGFCKLQERVGDAMTLGQ